MGWYRTMGRLMSTGAKDGVIMMIGCCWEQPAGRSTANAAQRHMSRNDRITVDGSIAIGQGNAPSNRRGGASSRTLGPPCNSRAAGGARAHTGRKGSCCVLSLRR